MSKVFVTRENYKEIAEQVGVPEDVLFDLLVEGLEKNEAVIINTDMIH